MSYPEIVLVYCLIFLFTVTKYCFGIGVGISVSLSFVDVPLFNKSLSNSFSFNSPSIIVNGLNSAYTGGTTVSIVGNGFALYNPTPTSRIALASAIATAWSSGSCIVCKVGSDSIPFSSSIVVSVQNKFSGSHSNVFSFDFASKFDLMNLLSPPTTGGFEMYLKAVNFGILQSSIRLRSAVSGCDASVCCTKSLNQCIALTHLDRLGRQTLV
jgi:hypothetical protein